MTIQEYSNKIINLRLEENLPLLSDDSHLEKTVLKNFQDPSETYFDLENLFDQSADESITLNTKIVQLFSDRLGLVFSSEKETGNVCFVNSSELRPEFRQSFTAIELLDYVYAFTHSSFYKEYQKIAIPSETDIFWKLVKIGASLSK